jgi:hypothetical protein
MEQRLRDALTAAGATIDSAAVRPLTTPEVRRYRVAVRPVAVMAAVAATAAVVLVGVGGAIAPEHHPSTEATVMASGAREMLLVSDVPEGDPDISVFLCQSDSSYPTCGGKLDDPGGGGGKGVTEEEITTMQEMLRSMPEVQSTFFKDQQQAYDEFRQQYADNKVLVNAVRPTDMPESFWLKAKPGTDRRALIEKVQDMPGVANVIDQRCAAELRAEKGDSFDWTPCTTTNIPR